MRSLTGSLGIDHFLARLLTYLAPVHKWLAIYCLVIFQLPIMYPFTVPAP